MKILIDTFLFNNKSKNICYFCNESKIKRAFAYEFYELHEFKTINIERVIFHYFFTN